MSRHSPVVRHGALVGLALVGASVRAQAPHELTRTTPAAAGMSLGRLNHMRDHFRAEVDRNSAAGYVLMVARAGKLVDSTAIGMRDRARRRALTLAPRFRMPRVG